MHDLVTLGEVLLRLSIPSPGRIETARQLDVQVGGAEANVAAACARLGLKVAWISALPANPWGERTRRELVGHGVDCAHVRMTEGARIGVYFLEYGVPPRPVRVLYDRRDSAFARLTEGEVDWEPVRRARLVHLTGITPALGEGARGLVRRAMREAPAFSFDVNYRASLWSPADARRFLDAVLPDVRHLFLGQAEARTVFNLTGTTEQTLEAHGGGSCPRRPERHAARGRHARRRPPPHHRRRGHRQDHRHHPADRLAHRPEEGAPRRDPGTHLHRQGGGRDGGARRHARALRLRGRGDRHLPRVWRPAAA